MKKEFRHLILRYVLRRLAFACAGLSVVMFVLLTYFLLRGSNTETGAIVTWNYLLIGAFALTAYSAYFYRMNIVARYRRTRITNLLPQKGLRHKDIGFTVVSLTS